MDLIFSTQLAVLEQIAEFIINLRSLKMSPIRSENPLCSAQGKYIMEERSLWEASLSGALTTYKPLSDGSGDLPGVFEFVSYVIQGLSS